MKEVINLIQHWDPKHVGEIVGIPNNVISRFEKVDEVTLPRPYRQFIETMGESLGPMHVSEANLEFVNSSISFGCGVGAPRYFFIAQHNPEDYLEDCRHFFLDLKDPLGEDFAVVRIVADAASISDFSKVEKEYASLREMLIYWAFHSIRALQFQHRALLYQPSGSQSYCDLEILDEIVADLGLQRGPHTDFWRYYDGEHAALCIERDTRTQKIEDVMVFANDEKLLGNTVESILDNTPLESLNS